MLAYHGDEKFRARFLDEIRWHQETDAVVQGTYGQMNGQWRGCAVGCSLRSLNRMAGKGLDTKTHGRYPEELGIPLVLAYLEDRLFEGLPVGVAHGWPLRFSGAIRAGADLSLVWPAFAHWLLVSDEHGVIRFAKTEAQQRDIRGVGYLFARQLRGIAVSKEEWMEVRRSAYAYADAAAADAAYAYASAYAAAYADADADADADAAAADASASAYAASASAYAAAADADASASAYAASASAYAADADADAARLRSQQTHYVVMADKLVQLLGQA